MATLSPIPFSEATAAAFVEAEVVGELDCGTHTIFLGQVVECDVLGAAEPVTYAYYHAVKGGKYPKNAPTYQKEEPPKTAAAPAAKAARYTCTVCGYVYDPEKGDPEGNVAAGTRFDDLPVDWSAPSTVRRETSLQRKGNPLFGLPRNEPRDGPPICRRGPVQRHDQITPAFPHFPLRLFYPKAAIYLIPRSKYPVNRHAIMTNLRA
jgi:rubredoxin